MTALIAAVPEAEPVVGHWRDRYDRSAAAGARAHVTVLFPFLDEDQIDAAVVGELTRTFAAHRAFTAGFRRVARRPGMLCLPPEPAESFNRLTGDVVARRPDHPPYGGRYSDTVPHLTVALRQPDDVLDRVGDDLAGRLPFSSAVTSIDLVAFDGRVWCGRRSFELGL